MIEPQFMLSIHFIEQITRSNACLCQKSPLANEIKGIIQFHSSKE